MSLWARLAGVPAGLQSSSPTLVPGAFRQVLRLEAVAFVVVAPNHGRTVVFAKGEVVCPWVQTEQTARQKERAFMGPCSAGGFRFDVLALAINHDPVFPRWPLQECPALVVSWCPGPWLPGSHTTFTRCLPRRPRRALCVVQCAKQQGANVAAKAGAWLPLSLSHCAVSECIGLRAS